MPIDVMALLITNLPKTLKTATGDSISIKWYDADGIRYAQGDGNAPKIPYGTIRRLSKAVDGIPDKRNAWLKKLNVATQGITFTTGTLTYFVSERDVDSITSITGTASGSPRTFVVNTDYKLVKGRGYSTYSTVEWQSAGTMPDNGTTFTVTYNHRTYDRVMEIDSRLTYELTLYVGDLRGGSQGATSDYQKTRLAEQLQEYLVFDLTNKRGKNLSGVAELTLGPVDSYPVIQVDVAQDYVRAPVDIVLFREQKDSVAEDVKMIGSVKVNRTTV